MISANGRVVPDVDIEQLKAEYAEAGFLSVLARKYGCTHQYISRLLREAGVDIWSQKERARTFMLKNKEARYPTCEELERLYVSERYSYSAIAKMFGVSCSTIHRLRQQFGLPAVSNTEAWKSRRPEADAAWRASLSRASKGKHNSLEAREKLSKTRSQRLSDGTIKNAHHYFRTGMKETVKSGAQHYESSYELKMFDLLDACSNVLFWTKRHRIIIPYTGHTGLMKNHIPDFWVEWDDDSISIYEVKPKPMIDYKNNPRKILAAAEFCSHHGYGYSVVTEEELGMGTGVCSLPDWVCSVCTDRHVHLLNPVPASASSG